MWRLGDDELILILTYLRDRHDRNSFSQVCKHWLRVERVTHTTVRLIDPDYLPTLLLRFPNLLHFHCSAPLSDKSLDLLSQTCPNLKTLDLSFRPLPHSPRHSHHHHISDRAVCALASRCRQLSAVSLRRRATVGDAGVIALCASAKHHLRHLDVGFCNMVSDDALEAIGLLGSLEVLNLGGCSLVTDRGLECLASGSSCKSLKRLVLAKCDRITYRGVCLLKGMSRLEVLNLANCGPWVTDVVCAAVIAAVPGIRKVIW